MALVHVLIGGIALYAFILWKKQNDMMAQNKRHRRREQAGRLLHKCGKGDDKACMLFNKHYDGDTHVHTAYIETTV
jgi:hypothetical protein